MRTSLRPKQVKKSTVIKESSALKHLRSTFRTQAHNLKVLARLDRKIEGQATQQAYYDSIPKKIVPPRIDVYETHVEFNREILVRTIVLGGERGDNPNFPPWISSKAFEEVMKLGQLDEKLKCGKISISTTVIKKPSSKSSEELQDAYREVNVEQYKVIMNDEVGTEDLGLKKQKQDIEARHSDVWDRAENSFIAQIIITIKGNEEEVRRGESHVITKLDSELIKWWEPEDLHMEAFVSSLLVPKFDPRFCMEVPSTLAAKLIAMTNINTRFDPKGMYFGNSRETNAHVVKDLTKLPAKHLMMYGATGSGKSYTAMVLLMRMKDILNHRIVYMTCKAPDRRIGAVTDYEAVARFYGEDGSIAVPGRPGFSINPLQIIYDEKNMQPGDYEYVWDSHRRGVSAFFRSIFKKDWSPNMEGLLEDNLDTVYEKAKIYRNKAKSWKNKFPTIGKGENNLRKIWLEIMSNKDKYSAEDRKTAGAFYRKTRAMKPGGSMEYLLEDTNFKYTDFMVIDLHEVDERIQDALYILITNILSTRFNIDSSKDTVVFVDEARAFLQDPDVCNFLINGVTKWRSRGVALWMGTQQPKDLQDAGVEEIFSNNMFMSIIMGAKMTPKTGGYVQQYFRFSDSVLEDLLTCNQGEGIFIDEEITPIRFEPTPLEKAVIENTYKEEKPESISGFVLNPMFLDKNYKNGENFIDHHGFFMKECVLEGDPESEKWFKYPVQSVIRKGDTNIYYRDGDLDVATQHVSRKGYGKMTIDHLASVIQMEVSVMLRIKEEIEAKRIVSGKTRTNHNNDIDLEIEIVRNDGTVEMYGAEYEEARSHTKEGLNTKWGKLLKYKSGKIFCSSGDFKTLSSAGLPTHAVTTRGKNFVTWLNSIFEMPETPVPAGCFESVEEEDLTEETDEYEELNNNTLETETEDILLYKEEVATESLDEPTVKRAKTQKNKKGVSADEPVKIDANEAVISGQEEIEAI